MTIEKTPTWKELMDLMKSPFRPVHWRLKARLLIEEEDVGVVKVVSFHQTSQYDRRYYGDQFIILDIDPLAHKKILKKTNQLQLELTKAQQSADGLHKTDVKRVSQRFNAHLMDTTHSSIRALTGWGKQSGDHTEQISNLSRLAFQLVEPIVADFRFAEVGGVFKGVTVEDVLRVNLGYGLPESPNKPLWEDPTYTGIRGVDVVKPSNQRQYQHIVIPNGTRLVHLPRFLQETYGIYSSGLGWHIDRGRCFIYPLLKYTDYGKRHKMLTILNIPVEEIPTMERTYIVRENQIYIFSTGDTEHEDISEAVQQDIGNGIRFSRASDLIDDMEESTNNKSIFDGKKNVLAYLVDKRPNEKNNVRFVKHRITDNPYAPTSEITLGLGTKVIVNWDNANTEHLYPGMQTKFLYKEADEIQSLEGTLMGVEKVISPATDALIDDHYITTCRLTLFLKRLPEIKR